MPIWSDDVRVRGSHGSNRDVLMAPVFSAQDDWEMVYAFKSLRLAVLDMVELWSTTLNRIRWIHLVVLTSDEQRNAWVELMCFYQTHSRQPDSVSHEELIKLVKLCVTGESGTWIEYHNAVMSHLDADMPIEYWTQPAVLPPRHDPLVHSMLQEYVCDGKERVVWMHLLNVDLNDPQAVATSATWLNDIIRRLLIPRRTRTIDAHLAFHYLKRSDDRFPRSRINRLPVDAQWLFQASICESYINQTKYPNENGKCPLADEAIQ